MDPNPTPWRTIDAAGQSRAEPVEPRGLARPPFGALAVAGAAALVLVAAFVMAFGAASGGSVDVEGASAARVTVDRRRGWTHERRRRVVGGG